MRTIQATEIAHGHRQAHPSMAAIHILQDASGDPHMHNAVALARGLEGLVCLAG